MGDTCIDAPPIQNSFHENCFSCNNCGEHLEEHNYYEYEDEVYCGRCHAEFYMPRCAGCDELIFDPTYTVAEGKKWHTVHFCCWVCDMDLCEKQYAKDGDGNPCCLDCYNDKYAVTCGTCKKPITAGEKAMKAGDKSYHHCDECFRCKECELPLENKKCVQYQDDIFCSGCYHKVHSPPCGRCGERVRGEFVEVRGTRYHKSCFNCQECSVPFTREEKKGAYPVGDRLLCYTHALDVRRKELKEAKRKKQEEEDAAAAAAEQASKEKEEEEEAAAAGAAAEQQRVWARARDRGKGGTDVAEPATKSGARAVSLTLAVPAISETDTEDGAAQPSSPLGSEPVEAKVNEGHLTPKSDSTGFVRQGTRKVTVIKKKPRASMVITEEDEAATSKAIAEAEAEAEAGGGADDDDEQLDLSSSPTREASGRGSREPGDSVYMDDDAAAAVVPEAEPGALPPTSVFGPTGSGRTFGARARTGFSKSESPQADPYAALYTGFSVPIKYSKFKLDLPGREVLDICEFLYMGKKGSFKVFLVLATDVAFMCKRIDDTCYELMMMPVERNKIKAKIIKMEGAVAFKVKIGKWGTLRAKDEIERSTWIGKLNAPIGFIPTKAFAVTG